jgi:hypothetical protein
VFWADDILTGKFYVLEELAASIFRVVEEFAGRIGGCTLHRNVCKHCQSIHGVISKNNSGWVKFL